MTGSYKLLVKVNENAASRDESSDNSILSAQIVNVAQGFFNVDACYPLPHSR